MNNTAQANFEKSRLDLIGAISEKLIPARERQEMARRAVQAAVAILRNPRASQQEKIKARADQHAAQQELAVSTAECSKLEAEAQRAREGTHPELARAAVAAQSEHQQQRAETIAKAEVALRSALGAPAITAALGELEAIYGRPVARKIAADLLVRYE
jgi:hypothetical protein